MANIYIVSTPIGNLKDITFRAIETLKNSELIICEDTRVSKKLLDHYGIKSKLVALNEYNEDEKSYEILSQIKDLGNISLISDAGTPLLSDPGYKFIKKASKAEHQIISIPGASAILTALTTSTMPTNSFTFLGFLSKSATKQQRIFDKYKNENHTIIIFESPHRVVKTLSTLKDAYGDILLTTARELTKKFEEVNTFPISKHLELFETKKPKGEFTIVLNPSIKEN